MVLNIQLCVKNTCWQEKSPPWSAAGTVFSEHVTWKDTFLLWNKGEMFEWQSCYLLWVKQKPNTYVLNNISTFALKETPNRGNSCKEEKHRKYLPGRRVHPKQKAVGTVWCCRWAAFSRGQTKPNKGVNAFVNTSFIEVSLGYSYSERVRSFLLIRIKRS